MQRCAGLHKRSRVEGAFRRGAYVETNDFLHRLHAERHAQSRLGMGSSTRDNEMSEVLPREIGAASSPDMRGSQANEYLHWLHCERLARRQHATAQSVKDSSAGADMDHGASAVWDTASMEAEPRAANMGNTNFSLADVVECTHGSSGRCLRCTGRLGQNVPLAVYNDFCRAYSSTSASSSVAVGTGELAFPALASLFASLAPEAGERFLHLGSGPGCAVIACALLYPQCLASGVEPRGASHEAAVFAGSRLDAAVQQRVHLHNCDPFAVRSCWKDASILLLSLSGLDDPSMPWVSEALQDVQFGARVVSLTQPLHTLPPGFGLAREELYRTSAGNVSAFIYRKSPRG